MSCGEEIDFISMGLELEKWKRFSELSIVYSLSKEHGIQIPGEWDLASQSPASGSDPTSPPSPLSGEGVQCLELLPLTHNF